MVCDPRLIEVRTDEGKEAVIGCSALMRTDMSIRRLTFCLACCVWLIASPALAHPHVWVTMKEELIYALNGALVEIRHAW